MPGPAASLKPAGAVFARDTRATTVTKSNTSRYRAKKLPSSNPDVKTPCGVRT
jgi:hypothetical protein